MWLSKCWQLKSQQMAVVSYAKLQPSFIATEKSQSKRDRQPVVWGKWALRGHAVVRRRCEAGIWAELLIIPHYVPLLPTIPSLTNLFHLTTGVLHLLLLLLREREREREREKERMREGERKARVSSQITFGERGLDCQAKRAKSHTQTVVSTSFTEKCCEESFLHNSGN